MGSRITRLGPLQSYGLEGIEKEDSEGRSSFATSIAHSANGAESQTFGETASPNLREDRTAAIRESLKKGKGNDESQKLCGCSWGINRRVSVDAYGCGEGGHITCIERGLQRLPSPVSA